MSEPTNEPTDQSAAEQREDDGSSDLAHHEKPEVGLIADEDLPEDLQPTSDNPLAQTPDDQDPGASSEDHEKDPSARAEGLPDMGDPGAAG
ncbi:MAG: hypothetical protein ACRDPR_06805 [Nocardioidaceae bacterium]